MIDFMRQRLSQKRHHIRASPPGNPDLSSVNTDRAIFAGMVDLEDSGDGQEVLSIWFFAHE
jgi:hypothetical protein